jgi:hypothetical protein
MSDCGLSILSRSHASCLCAAMVVDVAVKAFVAVRILDLYETLGLHNKEQPKGMWPM